MLIGLQLIFVVLVEKELGDVVEQLRDVLELLSA